MRVLLVEDEQKLADYVKHGLEEEGYAVDVSARGDEALDWAEIVAYDLIVLDVMLPALNGLTVCRSLREEGVRTPILMLTARDTIDDRVAGLDAGADDYLVKPFAMRELLARLRALARRPADAPKTTVLRVADLSLDVVRRTAERAGERIDLTTKEYAVLEALMRHNGQVLTREAIAAQVWNYETVHQSNIVDVYIRNLRRKIDDPFASNLIHTVRGAGYRISGEEWDVASAEG